MDRKYIVFAVILGILGIVWMVIRSGDSETVAPDTEVAKSASSTTPAVNSEEAAVKPAQGVASNGSTNAAVKDITPAEKTGKYVKAKEFVKPVGYFNIDSLALRPGMQDLTLADLKGKYVVLVDFWTYSCINCQRPIPFMNAWYNKYKRDGLMIVGVHTPEFAFEREKTNIQKSIQTLGINYPVLMDNNYDTWRAYGNRYWPHKYLIDIDGYIVYDHVGEGGYAEIERKIQSLLAERARKLGKNIPIDQTLVSPAGAVIPGRIRTPEMYFGADRNIKYLENGIAGRLGVQDITAMPTTSKNDRIYMSGSWDFTDEYATTKTVGANITLNYGAKDVYMVLHAPKMLRVKVLLDGKPLGAMSGKDIKEDKGVSYVDVSEYRIYHIVSDPNGYSEHKLELFIDQPGLDVYTFTFG